MAQKQVKIQENKFNESLSNLSDFIDTHNRLPKMSSSDSAERTLRRWLNTQRLRYERGLLDRKYSNMISSKIAFWTFKDTEWNHARHMFEEHKKTLTYAIEQYIEKVRKEPYACISECELQEIASRYNSSVTCTLAGTHSEGYEHTSYYVISYIEDGEIKTIEYTEFENTR